VIIFCRCPLTIWLVEIILDALCIPFVSLKSSMTADQRVETADLFNNPNASCSALVTNFTVGALGINIHDVCGLAVMMETAVNVCTLLQAIGRLHRIASASNLALIKPDLGERTPGGNQPLVLPRRQTTS
jgi:superfamily II DNA/RNA helicase